MPERVTERDRQCPAAVNPTGTRIGTGVGPGITFPVTAPSP